MLSAIKNSKIGIILAIVFGISLFLIKGGNRYSGIFGVGANDVAIVGDVKISNVQFQRIYDLNKNKFSELANKDLNNEEMRLLGLDQQSLSILINEAILKNEFNNLSLLLDDEVIAKKIKDFVPYLYDENNKIIESNLTIFLRNQNLNLENFIDIIRTQIVRDHYEDNLFNNISYPRESVKKISNINNHKRNTEYLVIPIEKLNLEVNIDENKIKKYYENNIKLFEEPEKRSIEYIEIDHNNLVNLFDIDNQQIYNYYNDNPDLFIIKEKRSFIQMNFNNEIDAKDFKLIINNILNYNEIKEIAKKNNTRFTEYESVDKDGILEEISNTVFKMKKNEISKIITSPLAFHITYIKKINPSYNVSIDDSKNKIIEILKNKSSIDYIQDLLENIDDDIINNISLNEISIKYNLPINKLIEVKNENSNNLRSLIINKAFKEKKDFLSNIYKGKDENSYFLFNVSKIIEPTIKNYDSVTSEAYKYWKIDEIKKLSNEKIQNIINNNKDNISILKKLSRDFKININKETISNNNNKLPKEFIKKIFNNKIDDPIHFYFDKNIYLGLVKSLIINDLNQNLESENIKINDEISDELKQIILKNFSKEIDIKINQDLLNLLTSNT